MVRLSSHAAVAVVMAIFASLSPETADAQEHPWCVSRESYLYCFYETQDPCVGNTTKQACQFERLVTFRTKRHQAGTLQGVCRAVIQIKPVR
jgi:hypothetical protein